MAQSSTVLTFIDTALYHPTHFHLPYTDPAQKSAIRAHLLDTLQTFPSLSVSLDSYTALNGAVTPLFKLSGDLPTPSLSSPDVSVTVWVHQDYPVVSPVVLTSTGPTSTPYLRAWRHPGSTLLGLLRSLLDQPSGLDVLAFTPRKAHALERALAMVQYDLLASEARHVADVDALLALQAGLRSRGEAIDRAISGLESEVMGLERLCRDMRVHDDVLTNWVRYNANGSGSGSGSGDGEAVVEAVDEESRWLVEGLAAERAIEDVMYALDKAVEEGVVGFEVYIRQIRVLARDQFWVRAKLVKLKGPNILHY